MSNHDFPPHSGPALAARLIDAGCVTVRSDEPFRLPSGWASPVYMDCRRVISFPETRRALVAAGLKRLEASGALNGVTAVAGGEASGIALAAWIADALNLPLQYVRKRGTGANRIEGVLLKDMKVLLVDDLMAAGTSKAGFVSALRARGARVQDIFVIFDYGILGADSLLNSLGLQLHALVTWKDVLTAADARNDFGREARIELAEFLESPSAWSLAHGGIGPAAG